MDTLPAIVHDAQPDGRCCGSFEALCRARRHLKHDFFNHRSFCSSSNAYTSSPGTELEDRILDYLNYPPVL